ncbi:SDR family NAD(P)-dependent oxidoreductase [Falsiroseomonas sp. HW251]|uniref:SDR family NAD(P)-dependent oxidoreductase n=1 Tax=Falsiroseomonas sp. HW251 TaxID=3390998 RepID=UPI003D31D549
MAPQHFAGETALVTGAGGGIGEGVARELAAAGAEVLLADIDTARGEAVIASLRAGGARASFVPADLAARDEADALLARIGEAPISLFVHAASPTRGAGETVDVVSAEAWDRMLDVNLRSGFFLGRALGNRWAATGTRGRMVFVTSLHADTPRNLAHYSAAKAGQVMVVRELARFFGPAGIRVNAVAPGAIPGGGFSADFAALAARIPLRRVGTPADVARAVAMLLSDAATGYVTGAVLPVDGGLALFNWIDAASAPAVTPDTA